jgi:hypothetical protein
MRLKLLRVAPQGGLFTPPSETAFNMMAAVEVSSL